MKKILVATALLTAISFNAMADVDIDSNKKLRTENRINKEQMKEKIKEGAKEAFKECSQTCNIDKEKVRQCRKALGAEKGDNLKGKCVTPKDKQCVKSCMGKQKEKHMKSMKKRIENIQEKRRSKSKEDSE